MISQQYVKRQLYRFLYQKVIFVPCGNIRNNSPNMITGKKKFNTKELFKPIRFRVKNYVG